MIGYIFGLVLGFAAGWVFAHDNVSRKCRKLGGFYVGNRVFVCTEKTKQNDTESGLK